MNYYIGMDKYKMFGVFSEEDIKGHSAVSEPFDNEEDAWEVIGEYVDAYDEEQERIGNQDEKEPYGHDLYNMYNFPL